MYSAHVREEGGDGGDSFLPLQGSMSDVEARAFDQAMRAIGERTLGNSGGASVKEGGVNTSLGTADGDFEEGDPADALLDWAGQLSFESYHEMWEKTAATVVELG